MNNSRSLQIGDDHHSSIIRLESPGGSDEKTTNTKKGKLKHRLLNPPLVALFSAYGRLVLITSRVRLMTPLPKDLVQGPVVIASWHQQIIMLPAISRTLPCRLLALVADSRAGRVISAVAARFDIDTVLGSKRRGGRESARSLIAAVRAGRSVFIAPDGSSGPAFVAKDGATKIARLSGAPLVPCAAWPMRGKTLDTWDRFRFPYPFNTIVVAFGEPLQEHTPEELEKALNALTSQVRQSTPSAV